MYDTTPTITQYLDARRNLADAYADLRESIAEARHEFKGGDDQDKVAAIVLLENLTQAVSDASSELQELTGEFVEAQIEHESDAALAAFLTTVGQS